MYRRNAEECRAGPSHQEDPIVIVDSDCEETSNNIILLSEQIFAQERPSLTRHTQFPEVITLDSDGDEVCPITDQPSTSTSSAPRKISLKWTIPRGRLGERMSKRPKVIAYNEKKIRYEAFCEFIENNNKCPNGRQMYIHPIIHDVEYVKRRICSVFFSALEKNRKSFKRELDLSAFIFNPSYYPRDTIHGSIKRLRFTPDIRAVEATLPIFCDMPMTSSDVIFTNMTSFNHESRNYMSPDLVGAKEAKKIVACCSCTYKCELPTCECLRLQHAICGSEIQNKGYGIIEDHHDFVEFSSSEPSRKQMDNYSTVLITCGDLCACSRIEPCDNHISKLNRGHRFEYFRTDKKKGFGLRTLNPIQMDQVVVEFVGCVKPVGSIKTQSSLDYSFEQSSDDLVYLLDLIQKNTKVYSDEDFGMVSKTENGSGKGLSFETYIDPYCLGSEARQASHSCTPNCGLLRVISNYLHPYYHRLFYKAMVPIPAGTEIAISYGPAYMKRSGFACKCGTILCKNAPRSMKQLWASLTFDQKVEALTSMVQNWQEIIVADHDSYFGFVKAEPEDTALPCHVMLECEELKTRNEMILDPGKLEAMKPLSDHESDLAVKASYMNRNIEDIQFLESELAAAAARYLKARKLLESPDLLSRRASEGCIEILDVVPAPTPPRRRGRPSKRKFPSLGPSLDDSLSTSTTKSSRSSTESDPPDDPCTPTTTKCLETYFQGRVTLNSRKICE